MQLEDIKRRKVQLNQIAAKYGIKKVYVFGSVARGESKEFSDVDFLIEMDDDRLRFRGWCLSIRSPTTIGNSC